MHINLPPDLPPPKYHFNQEVQWFESQGCIYRGVIRGLQYFTPAMSKALCNSLDWVGWSYLVEVNGPAIADIQDVHENDLVLREVMEECTF